VPAVDCVTPLIIRFHDEPNIGRVLDPFGWAERIVVVESLSQDPTPEIT